MKFEHASFSRSGRSIRIADQGCPFEVTLAWLYCALHQAYVDHWYRNNGTTQYQTNRFQPLNRYMLTSLLGGTSPDVPQVLSRIGQGPSLLELAQDIETGKTELPPLARTGNQSYVWFSRRIASQYLDVPGYQRAMALVEDLALLMSREATSSFRTEEAVSFLKRVDPVIPQLSGYRTPGAQYAQALLAHLATWDRRADRCLSLVP